MAVKPHIWVNLHIFKGRCFEVSVLFGCQKITGGGQILSEANPRGRSNPRTSNGTLRRKHRARFKAMNAPCGICRGRFGPIHYDEPSDSNHPLSFVIDEIKPVSRWREFGYDSPQACAQDWSNLQAAHFCCNQAKGNRTEQDRNLRLIKHFNQSDGEW